MNTLIRLRRRLLLSLCAGLLPGMAAAADYPEKPIRLVVPFAAGGGVDALARPLAREMAEILGQNVFVDVKPSNTGQIGAMDVAHAAPDGYTVLISSAAFGTTPAFYPKVPYQPVKDFEQVTILATTPQVLVANAAYPVASVADVLQAVRSGKQVNFALSGSTGIQSLATELLSSLGHVQLTKVPYKGAGAAFADLIGGQVDLMIDNPASSLVHVRSGKLKLLATTGQKRMASQPDTPTVAETLPGFEALNWFVLAVPARTPPAVVQRLHAAAVEAMRRPALRQMAERDGLDVLGTTPEQARAFVSAETDKWTRVVKEKGLQVQ
ncbi:tripartite tricarboxylate transporter substrate-binding protein [Xylophilus sp. GOD-11R]|uniref:tripartite tricarboxylate transporter substrate-binding protein n=1 Tax=Xylophilus sp. GOD-11R TaxID=3089814 RepID=UPI00298CF5B5|nr:tripartite tricarboxylate transporter substrate-binding protein [Xylophilus sp. GOD-11R]WPB55501.1 tripartite tricarboxylate transporter substrate-binding protein [Xylophilus sp. GOD-11R]